MSKLKAVFQGRYLRQSLLISVVVGTALNLINQPEAMMGDATPIWWKVILTYMVPFFVSTYAAYGALPDPLDHNHNHNHTH